MVTPDPPSSLSETAQDHLERVLGIPGALNRQEQGDDGDPRSLEDLQAHFEPLDALIQLLELHIAQAATRQMDVEPVGPTRPFVAPKPPPNDAEKVAFLLYEDIVWLFAVNDGEGALISLERMLQMGEPTGEAKEFVDGNEAKLLQLYEDYMGPFYKKVSHGPLDPRTEMPESYLAQGALTQIYEMVEGDKTIQDLMDESPLRPLVTCATLKQLHRSHAIQID